MSRTYRVKLGDRGGVQDWQALETSGDVKRFLRWVILSARNQTMTTRDAAVFGQLALAMLKTVETSDLERRIDQLEQAASGTTGGTTNADEETAEQG